MKILLASYVFAPAVGGIETMSATLADEFVRQGHTVMVVTQTPNSEPDRFAYSIVRRPNKRQLLRLARWCDVFFHNNISLQTAWAPLAARKPWVVTHQTWLTRADGTQSWQDFAKRWVCQRVVGIAISQAVAAQVPPVAAIIGNCYRDDLFRLLPDVPRDSDLVFLGRLVSDKGGDVLLRALAELQVRGITPHLTMIGAGPERDTWKQLAKELQVETQVQFVGSKSGEQLVHLLNRHKVMVVPSRWAEPFGIVALEGIACGCVVVGSADGGLPDAIGPCGVTFPNGDSMALARMLEDLLMPGALLPFRQVAVAHLARHTSAAVAAEYLKVFENVLQAARVIIYSHPTGNANVRQSVQALSEANLLAEFWTGIDWNPNSAWSRLVPPRLVQQLARRAFPECARGNMHTAPWREAGRLLAPVLGLQRLTQHEIGPLSVDAVFHDLDRRVARRLEKVPNLTGVYAGEDGARDTFHRAKQLGLTCFYDLPIGYWRAAQALYAEEAIREPLWAGTLTGRQDSPAKLARKDEELALADVIFVASEFTRQTLDSAPNLAGRVEVVPYGAPPLSPEPEWTGMASAPLRLLFVGSLTQRKGLSYLLDAVKQLGEHVTLTLIGTKPASPCVPLDDALRRHRRINSLPHHDVLAEMRQHDLLLFPSLFEGFGLVILEAMSQGLPVLATSHTAGPDIITEGEDGFIVPIRSAEAMTEKISLLLSSPILLADMKQAAWKTAQRHTWTNYRNILTKIIRAETAA